ncbi:zinc-binding protein [Ktedonosporobacter rubrisoli]|uniref:Zinc-binding protein n=1 Tax=Ktedonosporobacter rubrisoli TaxID=2509675 RepID=A0A4P6JX18_KTERU|nr:zinc-ribbon domain containing protein [Ktedonosporobacter rubrisoli]QBD79910.1 zinc-binding protein [Ktedonosporobacter rubrisoli]
MLSNDSYQDRLLTCRDCGNDFTFSAGEQEFFARKGLTNPPSRCPQCRAARRGGSAGAPRAQHSEQYEAVCASCGRLTTVPFQPREDRPVYCSDCFQSQRASRPRRDSSRSYSGSYGGGRGRERRERDSRW